MRKLLKNGKLSFIIDASFGSSGKGKVAGYVTKKYGPNFLVTTNSANASHTVVDGDRSIVFKALPSGTFYHDSVDNVYIGPGASFKVVDLLREIDETGISREKVKIHPLASIITVDDERFEKGTIDLDGNLCSHDGTIKTGSTCSGSGAALARKVLRRSPTFAKDVFAICDMIAVTESFIMRDLDRGKSGLFEIGQGFPLSLNHWRFSPHTTSRNVTVSAALNDAMLPPVYAGPLILNFRTFPIRINSKKYIGKGGEHLTWDQVKNGVPHNVVDSNSGNWYPDQEETSWEELESNGIMIPDSVKNTTLTKLPRRIASFSKTNVEEAIKYNDTGDDLHISVNFINHVDQSMYGKRLASDITDTAKCWLKDNLTTNIGKLSLIGTSQDSNDCIDVSDKLVYTERG